MSKKPLKLSDFRPQSQNANSHTERGLWALEESISQNGWIGSITTSADGEVFDGSARIEKAFDLFGDDVEPIVVEIDGTRPVIMKRIDIATADDPKAKLLAISANRVAQLNLNWNPEILSGLDGEVDISGLFTGDELKALSVEGGSGSGEGEDSLLEFNNDKDLNESGYSQVFLKWQKKNIALADDEIELINTKFEEYTKEFGASFGFVRWLCG